jgi:hypothetical protein
MRWLGIAVFATALGFGFTHAWAAASNHSMNADGISYLDMGDAYVRGEWQAAINSVWSPMYAWVLGAVMRLVDPPMRWEFPTVHIVNFTIYLLALLCFAYFWRQVMNYHHSRTESSAGVRFAAFPDWALSSLGYLLFISSSLILIEIWSVTPDMLMAAFVYLAAGLVVRLRLGFVTWRTFILLGLVLGLGYLTKAIMLPVTVLFLGISLFTVGNVRLAAPRVLAALIAFLALALPYIVVVSQAKEEFTLGDAGAFTYAKHVNGVPFSHWQGETIGNGTPLHPSRKILEEPPIFEFGTPIGGTYPISYDPSYWYEGLETNFNLRQQMNAFVTNGLFYVEVFFRQYGALVFGTLLLYLMKSRQQWQPVDIVSRWGLALIALAVFAFYAVVAVAGRYIGVFVVLFWSDLLANIHLPEGKPSIRLIRYASIIMIAFMIFSIVLFSLEGYLDLNGTEDPRQTATVQARPPSWPGEVTGELQLAGLQEGDPVGVIGYAFDSFWARLGRFKIVAEMLRGDAKEFWFHPEEAQPQVIEAFAGTGVKAIVAENVPSHAFLPGWDQIGDSNYFVYILEPRK